VNFCIAFPCGVAPQVADTLDVDGARRSYFTNLFPLNPSGIVPSGPSAADLGLLPANASLPAGSSFSNANWLNIQDVAHVRSMQSISP
jgi:hypothetical protein